MERLEKNIGTQIKLNITYWVMEKLFLSHILGSDGNFQEIMVLEKPSNVNLIDLLSSNRKW